MAIPAAAAAAYRAAAQIGAPAASAVSWSSAHTSTGEALSRVCRTSFATACTKLLLHMLSLHAASWRSVMLPASP